jgi:hypothetical protein
MARKSQERIFVTTGHLTDWRKSSFCGSSACVEVAKTGDEFLVRDSKDANSPVLKFTVDEWSAFLAGVNAGEFSA